MEYFAKAYDVAVIGAGHAGIEAGLAAARLGCSTAVFTINMDWVGNMPCNPSIGGTSKGHLVREIDALGGEMGKAADRYTLQSRMLNLGKGPAVHSLRAQIDRRAYAGGMKHTLERQDNLDLRQCEITDIVQGEDGLWCLTTKLEAIYTAKAVVLATGTFLGGRVYVGDVSYESGPDGMFPATALATALKKLGLPLRRFKTGTPSRVNARSLDFDKMEVQPGDDRTVPFSFETDTPPENKVVCHITYTNAATKQVILDNLDRSPMYSGKIEGKGPRYCPSFEDKVVRFSDRERHQLFVEPCGEKTEEMYLQGLSSSLPEDVQLAFIHTIPGLEHAQVLRTAYAIEYDCVDPRAMKASLEFHDFPGLFGAGQFNGSSGYEEAAAQGLVAGINAAMLVLGREPLVLDRGSSYIGTLIDDLVTKGCTDPYRMMTSRSEYRLVLRQDNADARLTEKAYELGIATRERYDHWLKKKTEIERIVRYCDQTNVKPRDINDALERFGTTPMQFGTTIAGLVARPQLSIEQIASALPTLQAALQTNDARQAEIVEAAEILIKYKGYIERERLVADKMHRLEDIHIKGHFNYAELHEISTEGRQKLTRINPETLGQAARIPGVSPSDINVLLVLMKR